MSRMKTPSVHILLAAGLLVGLSLKGLAQPPDSRSEATNYDESKVVQYVLPDPLVMRDGRVVTSEAIWRSERRPELLELFETQVYGRRSPAPKTIKFHLVETLHGAVHGQATRKRIRVELPGDGDKIASLLITLFVPSRAAKPVPAFVGMHLFDTSADEPVPGKPLDLDVGEKLPGAELMQTILQRGYAIATLDAKDFCPDDKATFREGVLEALYPRQMGPPGPEEPGAIATWAWGLSRALDYLETDRDIDAHKVAVIGHSRMGKTALWAGAEDARFALIISNNSGCGGAALSRRNFGETVGRITRVFPHWFCGNFSKYALEEDSLPVDQHQLIALIAPRPVYIASAEEDRWADPKGEFLAAVAADPVYRLLGKPGLEATGPELPPVGKSIGKTIGYHIRVGKHALTDYDWLRYLDFADRQFGK